MRTPFLIAVFVTLLISCKKDEQPEPSVPAGPAAPATLSDYSKLAIGNWWVYSTQRYDTNGVYTNVGIGRDTIRITRDTVIHNDTFFIVEGTTWGTNLSLREFWRDSADCLINETGKIFFCYGRYDQVLRHDSVPGYYTADYVVSSVPANVSTGAGNFSAYVMTVTYDRVFWGITVSQYSYSRGIGRVMLKEDFPAQPGGLEQRLMNYGVQ
jgi:hypothetical protein